MLNTHTLVFFLLPNTTISQSKRLHLKLTNRIILILKFIELHISIITQSNMD